MSSQDILIKAAIAARVYRIMPSEFGSDTLLEANKKLPMYFQKLLGVPDVDDAEIVGYIKQAAAA